MREDMNKLYVLLGIMTLAACATTAFPSIQDGLLTYAGSQMTIFETGKAEAKVPVSAMSGAPDIFGVAAVAGLDGEVTVFAGKPYVTKVRGGSYAPAVPPESGHKNAMHIHLVTKDGKSAGHIDNLILGTGMTLRLPKL
jgi:hypothetical protein